MGDKLHWSFNDSPMLVNKVFPEGFSAAQSTLPGGAFDPASDWENAYDVVYPGPQDFSEDKQTYYGSLRITAQFKKDRIALGVRGIRQSGQDYREERQHMQADSICRRDPLFSLKADENWNLQLRLKNQVDPATKPYAAMNETGRLQSGKLEKQAAAGDWYTYRTVASGMPVVSDWALLAAVQTLPRDREFTFGYFQQLERFSPGHRIHFMETFAARFGDHDITLHGYAQTGPDIIPSYYWVDDHGRLLIARFALSMLVYNSNPRLEKIAANDA